MQLQLIQPNRHDRRAEHKRLAVTIDGACEITGLGRTKIYELISRSEAEGCCHRTPPARADGVDRGPATAGRRVTDARRGQGGRDGRQTPRLASDLDVERAAAIELPGAAPRGVRSGRLRTYSAASWSITRNISAHDPANLLSAHRCSYIRQDEKMILRTCREAEPRSAKRAFKYRSARARRS